MKSKERIVSGMIFHPPSYSILDKFIKDLFPFFFPFYSAISLGIKKKILKYFPDFHIFNISNILSDFNQNISLIGIMLPLLPQEFFSDRDFMRGRICRAINRFEKKGGEIVTLGGFSSIATNQGMDIVEKVSCKITTGNTYTAAACLKSIENVCKKLEISLKDVNLSIIGATGDIGLACAKSLVSKINILKLCSRDIDKSFIDKNFSIENQQKIFLENDTQKAILNSDIVICATSSYAPLFEIDDFDLGTIICDISIPVNVQGFDSQKNKQVLLYEGGKAQLSFYNSINNKIWKYLFPKNCVYGCLAESLVLALENKIESFSIGRGRIDKFKMDEIYSAGLKHGIKVADFFYGDYQYKESDFLRLKEIRKNK